MKTRWIKRLVSKEGTENLLLDYIFFAQPRSGSRATRLQDYNVLHEQANDYGF